MNIFIINNLSIISIKLIKRKSFINIKNKYKNILCYFNINNIYFIIYFIYI